MSSNQLERVRQLHEDIELFERAAADELAARGAFKSRPDQIMSDHTTHTLLSRIGERNAQLDALYDDEDDLLRDEVDAMTGEGAIDTFYAQLDRLRAASAAGGEGVPIEADAEERVLVAALETDAPITFSGEEAEGRYVDLHDLYDVFVNLRGIKPKAVAKGAKPAEAAVDYYTFLSKVVLAPDSLPTAVTREAGYQRYLGKAVGALCDFVRRTQPLVELDALLRDAEAALDARWAKVEVPRWQRGGADAGAPAAEPTSAGEGGGGDADVGAFASAEALEAGVSAEQLKRELQARGLKCGGRVAERAQRLWLALHDPTQLDKRARATAATAAPAGGGGSTTGAAPDAHARKCASLEAALGALAPLVREAVADTCAHVEKAAARTYEEIEADLLAGEAGLEGAEGDDSDDDDGAAPVYNPKNLPLGWDGKPIPFWLYKLHGLNLEFKCEICGGASYWGPREFERHFQEARHAHSMRCLGIANTKAFHGITQIDQAYALQKTLDNDTRQKRFVAELDEEYEDSLGNVMPKKTYEDLARQGLL